MFNIIKWELWQRRFSITWWCIGIVAFITINLAFYPSFRDQAAQAEQAFSQIPDSAMAFFSDTGDFLSPTGYLSSQIFYLMLPLLLGTLAISLGSSLLAREEKEGTIELLLSRPVSRGSLIVGKLSAGIIILTIVGTVAALVTAGLSKLVKLAVPTKGILLASIAAVLLAMSFGIIAFLITALGKARIASVGIATLFALGGYILASLVDIADWLKWPAKIFPFNYYKPAEILSGSYDWTHIIYIVAIICLATAGSLIAFRRRDLD